MQSGAAVAAWDLNPATAAGVRPLIVDVTSASSVREGLAQIGPGQRIDILVNCAGYSAASAGVIAFTKALSRETARDHVFVNCVAPGPIDTDMIRDLGAGTVARMIQDSPLGRLGEPAEVAHLVAWLCSEASRFNTGAVLDMSGGRARY